MQRLTRPGRAVAGRIVTTAAGRIVTTAAGTTPDGAAAVRSRNLPCRAAPVITRP